MESIDLKRRFCKDYNLPIKVYDEPYFTQRLNLFDSFFNCLKNYELFISEVKEFKSEQDYFEYYNKVKDDFIVNLKSKKEYEEFNNYDFNVYKVNTFNIPNHSIYKEGNLKNRMISIDLKKGNYSALRYFNKSLVDNMINYEELIGKFTDLKHIISSKYIRQVVFGNCNPRRQVTLEKFMMSKVLNILLRFMPSSNILSYTDDEIVYLYVSDDVQSEICLELNALEKHEDFVVAIEDFTLSKVKNMDIYFKNFNDNTIKIKGLNALMSPFVIRALKNERVEESDMVFYHEGYLCRFLSVPEIVIL